jgi:hypothetical protein
MALTTSNSSGWGFVEDIGKALALAAVLLPVTGVLVRLIAFVVGQTVNHTLDLALSESPAVLIATGVESLLICLAVLPLFGLWAYLAPLEHRIRRLRPELEAIARKHADAKTLADLQEVIDRQKALQTEIEIAEAAQKNPPLIARINRWSAGSFGAWMRNLSPWRLRALAVIYFSAIFLISPWPQSVSFIGVFLVLFLLPRLAMRTGRVAFSQVWPLVLFVLLLAAIGAGLDGRLDGTGAGEYHFAAAANLVDGRYARLGEASDRTILLTCGQAGAGAVTAVANSNIKTVGLEPWRTRTYAYQTLFGVLTGEPWSLGFHNPC